jgi:phytoene dehydrogenase-like protein
MDFVEQAYDDAKYGHPSSHPMIEATIPSTVDDTLAPKGEHVMGIFCQYAPYNLKEGNWDSEKTVFANRIIDDFTRYAPNFRNSIIDYELLTPPDIEKYLVLPEVTFSTAP